MIKNTIYIKKGSWPDFWSDSPLWFFPSERGVAGGQTGYQVRILQPGLGNNFMCVCCISRTHAYFSMFELRKSSATGWLTCQQEMLQGVCHPKWIYQLSVIFGGPPSLKAHRLGIYPDWCKSSMDDVRMLGMHAPSVHTSMHRAPGHITAQSMLCGHTPSGACDKLHCAFHVQQLSWGGASRAASSTEGEHPRGLTRLSWTFHRTPPPPLTYPLGSACNAATIWWLTWENLSNSAAQLHRKISRANSYDAHRLQGPQGLFDEFWSFMGVGTGEGGEAIPAQGSFYFRVRDVGAVTQPHPLQWK